VIAAAVVSPARRAVFPAVRWTGPRWGAWTNPRERPDVRPCARVP